MVGMIEQLAVKWDMTNTGRSEGDGHRASGTVKQLALILFHLLRVQQDIPEVKYRATLAIP
jgi:hypothetical protein